MKPWDGDIPQGIVNGVMDGVVLYTVGWIVIL